MTWAISGCFSSSASTSRMTPSVLLRLEPLGSLISTMNCGVLALGKTLKPIGRHQQGSCPAPCTAARATVVLGRASARRSQGE